MAIDGVRIAVLGFIVAHSQLGPGRNSMLTGLQPAISLVSEEEKIIDGVLIADTGGPITGMEGFLVQRIK